MAGLDSKHATKVDRDGDGLLPAGGLAHLDRALIVALVCASSLFMSAAKATAVSTMANGSLSGSRPSLAIAAPARLSRRCASPEKNATSNSW